MKNKHFYQFISLLFLIIPQVKADSPVTSTGFSEAYANEAIIQKARLSGGVINDELMTYLFDRSNPIDVRLAVINELSWDINGKDNYSVFLEFCKSKTELSEEKLFRKAKGDLLICLAYLKAMDNYFEVREAFEMAVAAHKRSKRSYSIHLIAGIIEGQHLFSSDWCEVYKSTDKVRTNKKLKVDMKSEAITIVFEYMDLYADSCNND